MGHGVGQRQPRAAKFRASCDMCGIAKLKCDRESPCGRCVARGHECVYGVSKKSGKPPRDKQRRPNASPKQKIDCSVGQANRDAGVEPAGFFQHRDSFPVHPAPFSASSHAQSHWSSFHEYPDNRLATPESSAAQYDGFFGFAVPEFHGLPAAAFSNDFAPTGVKVSPLSSPTSLLVQNEVPSSSVGMVFHPDAQSSMLPPCSKDINCTTEVHELLGELQTHNKDPLTHWSTEAAVRFSRETSERLGSIMSCACTRLPHLSLLIASFLSRIFTSLAASSDDPYPPPNPSGFTADSVLSTLSPRSLSIVSGPSPSLTAANMSSSCTNSSTIVGTAPATHDIDRQVERALRYQLLLGEIRRLGRLTEMFISTHDCEASNKAISVRGDHNFLFGVDQFLREDYSRITEFLKSRLLEVNV